MARRCPQPPAAGSQRSAAWAAARAAIAGVLSVALAGCTVEYHPREKGAPSTPRAIVVVPPTPRTGVTTSRVPAEPLTTLPAALAPEPLGPSLAPAMMASLAATEAPITMTTSVTATTTLPLFSCSSPFTLPTMAEAPRKGFCVDDTTLGSCPGKMLGVWPNTDGQRVTSLRLFKPWHPSWGGDDVRTRAWAGLAAWASASGAKVLLGTEVTCDSQADDQMWAWTLELMRLLGKDRILGVAFGNELDIFRDAEGSEIATCSSDLWGGDFWRTLEERVSQMDSQGFQDTRITSVWAMSVLEAEDTAFREDKNAGVNTLLTKAVAKWGRRWAWAFNVYAVWDRDAWPTSEEDCAEKVAKATSLSPIKGLLRDARKRIKRLTGNDDDTMWVAETGWSSHAPKPVLEAMPFCPQFSSLGTLQKSYRHFLEWDLSIGGGLAGPEQAFYFTMRDSTAEGPQGFGLVASCGSAACKVQNASGPAPTNMVV